MSGFVSNPTQVLAAGDITTTSTGGDHIFKTDDPATTKFRIENDGQVVIGTSATAASGALLTLDGFIALQEQASVPAGAPHADNYGRLYAKNDDQLYYLDDAGLETQLTTPGGGPPIGAGWSDLGNNLILTTASDRIGIGAATSAADKVLIRGLGTTSATNTLIVEDQSGTNLFVVRDDGLVTVTGTIDAAIYTIGGSPLFGSGTLFIDKEVPTGAVNGVNLIFNLANSPIISGSDHVFVNGILQEDG